VCEEEGGDLGALLGFIEPQVTACFFDEGDAGFCLFVEGVEDFGGGKLVV
jgi:hypothetical protein